MAVLSLKTELDVAELLLTEGWFPEEINAILVFPLPRAAFHQLDSEIYQKPDTDVVKATEVTPTVLHRARQLLKSAGWLERELDSLLKPCLYSIDPWANQTIHTPGYTPEVRCYDHLNKRSGYATPLSQYRRTMALKRIVSLALVIVLVTTAVVVFG